MLNEQHKQALGLAKQLEGFRQSAAFKSIINWIVGCELAALDRMYEAYTTEKYPAQQDLALAAAGYCEARKQAATLIGNLIQAEGERRAIMDEIIRAHHLEGLGHDKLEAVLESE